MILLLFKDDPFGYAQAVSYTVVCMATVGYVKSVEPSGHGLFWHISPSILLELLRKTVKLSR
jgi:hypothetical protein